MYETYRGSTLSSPEHNKQSETLNSHQNYALAALQHVRYLKDGALHGLTIDKEKDTELLSMLTPFIMDRGCAKPISGLTAEEWGNCTLAPGENAGAYSISELQPTTILSSSMARPLLQNAYVEVAQFDGVNVNGANSVSMEEGDRCLRRITTYLQKKMPDSFFVRYGGDAFLVVRPRNTNSAQSIPLHDELTTILQEIAPKPTVQPDSLATPEDTQLATLFEKVNGIVIENATAIPQEVEVAKVLDGTHELPGTLLERKKRILQYHPEQEDVLQLIEKKPIEEHATFIEILENSLFDHILQPMIEEHKDLIPRVRAFRDAEDFAVHLKLQSIHLVKLDMASLLKLVNDHPKGGKNAGDEAIRKVGLAFLERLQQRYPDQEINILRRWGDFFIAMHEQADTDEVQKIIEQLFNERAFIVFDKPPNTPHGTLVSTPSQDTERLAVRLLPVMVALRTDFSENHIDLLRQNKTYIERMYGCMNEIDAAIPEKRTLQLAKLVLSEHTDALTMSLIEWRLNPYDKRGLPRLVKELGATPEEIQALETYYEFNGDRTSKQTGKVLEGMHGTVRNIFKIIFQRRQEFLRWKHASSV